MSTSINHLTLFIFPEENVYPLTLAKIKALPRHRATSWPAEPSEELMNSLGYYVVNSTPAPVADVVTEVAPTEIAEGEYVQTFVGRPYTPEEQEQQLSKQRAIMLAEVFRKRSQALERGAPINFGATFGVQHIQMRDGDRANIIGLRIDAQATVDAGGTDLTGVRTFENVLVPLTPQQMIELSGKVLTAYKEVMKSSWDLQDLINAAEEVTELPVLPEALTPTEQSVPAAF